MVIVGHFADSSLQALITQTNAVAPTGPRSEMAIPSRRLRALAQQLLGVAALTGTPHPGERIVLAATSRRLVDVVEPALLLRRTLVDLPNCRVRLLTSQAQFTAELRCWAGPPLLSALDLGDDFSDGAMSSIVEPSRPLTMVGRVQALLKVVHREKAAILVQTFDLVDRKIGRRAPVRAVAGRREILRPPRRLALCLGVFGRKSRGVELFNLMK